MDLSLTTAKIVGTPGDTGWAQALDYTPDDDALKKARGRLLVIATFNNPQEGINSILIGREIISALQDEYYNNTDKSAFSALQISVGKISEKYSDKFNNIELTCASFVGNVVYSVACNGSQVMIYRGGALAKILVSTKGSCVSASGYPKENDLLLLASSRFFTKFSDGVIKAAMETRSATKAGEQLMPTVHSSEGVSDLAAMFISFGHELGEPEKGVLGTEKKDEEDELEQEQTEEKPSKIGRFKSLLPKRKLYVRERSQNLEEVKSRKTTVSVGLILLLLLMVSIFFGVRQKRTKDYQSSYEDRLVQAEHLFEEALKLTSLDPDRARDLYLESETVVESLISEGIDDDRLESLEERQKSERGKVLGEYKADTQLYIDTSLYSEGFSGDKISTTSGNIYLLDMNTRRVIKVETETKNAEVVANPDSLKDPEDIASYSDRVFALEEDGVYEVGDTRTNLIEKEWAGSVLVYAYSGNFYILEKEASTIRRYPGLGEGYATGKVWFAPGIEVNLSDVLSWVIDGSIWVIDGGGLVRKYTQGLPENIETIESPGAGYVYTNEDLDDIYLLNAQSGKIIIFDKDGNYKAQYVDERLVKAKGLSVNKEKKLVILLADDGQLYSFELVHVQ